MLEGVLKVIWEPCSRICLDVSILGMLEGVLKGFCYPSQAPIIGVSILGMLEGVLKVPTRTLSPSSE